MPAGKAPDSRGPFSSWRAPTNRADWLVLLATGSYWLWQQYKDSLRSRRDTFLKFSPEDSAYYWLLRWLETMPRQKGLSVFSVRAAHEEEPDGPPGGLGRREKKPPIMVPTEGVNFVFHGVRCHVDKCDEKSAGLTEFRRRADLNVRIESRNPEIAVAFLREIFKAGTAKKAKPSVFVYQYGWVPVRTCPTGRAAILPTGQYEQIKTDLKLFLDEHEWYEEIGVPYRRSYLFHGLTGSGKTTAVMALAGDFGYNVCLLSLPGHNDNTLLEATRNLPSNSFVLLEDVDCAHNGRVVKTEKQELTFSGLLNVLDGAATPEGRVTFLTTNHRDKLDAALIRPGRVDLEIEFTYARQEQIDEMTKRFARKSKIRTDTAAWASEEISMAQVQERLIRIYR